jgi:hypothetical protein
MVNQETTLPEGYVLQTTDGGSTWSSAQVPDPTGWLSAISCGSSSSCVGLAYSKANNAAYPGATALVSSDGGATWANATMPAGVAFIEDVSCLGRTCKAVGATDSSVGVILGSLDAGETWQAQAEGYQAIEGVSCTTGTTCEAVGRGTAGISMIVGTSPAISANPLKITTTSLPPCKINKFCSVALHATGGVAPYAWSIGSALPRGLSLNPATGVISGTPSTWVKQSLSVRVVDHDGSIATGNVAFSVESTLSSSHGYWLVGSDGGIFTFGSAQFYGSTGDLNLQRPVVGISSTSSHGGYWLVASDGGIFSFGDAGFHGSIPGLGIAPAGAPGAAHQLNAPVVGMVPSEDGGGYFMVASDGGVFAFGDAQFEGSCPSIGGCSGAAVAVVPDASGGGYWLVTVTGHVYAFGDARYFGAPSLVPAPVTSAVRTPSGNGYWILLANGSVYSFGDATPHGGTLAGGSNPASAIFSTSDGGGYWIGTANGGVFPFGDAPKDGSMAGQQLNAPISAAVGW